MAYQFSRRKRDRNVRETEGDDETNHRPRRETFEEWRAKWEFTWTVFVSLCAGFGAVLFGIIELLRFFRELGWWKP